VKFDTTLTAEGKKFMKMLKDMNNLEVRIGIQEGPVYEKESGKEVSVVNVALWNEFGTETIPSRPFMRDSVDTNSDKINALLQAEKKKLLNGGSAEEVLNEIGDFQERLMVEQIKNNSYAENKEPYKRKKERENPPAVPLIDTGKMWQSIHHVIARKGEYD
jgi:hypothetical protein